MPATAFPRGRGYDAWPRVTFRRGFVEQVALPCVRWVGEECDCVPRIRGGVCLACHGTGVVGRHGPSLLRAAPIERVVLTDREPARDDVVGEWLWMDDPMGSNPAEHSIPSSVWHLLDLPLWSGNSNWKKANSRQAALDAASAAYLAWARLAVEQEDVRRELADDPLYPDAGGPLHVRVRTRLRELDRLVG